MKAYIFIICFLLFCPVYTYGQAENKNTEDKKDSIAINIENKLPESYKGIEVETGNGWESENRKNLPAEELKRREEFVKNLRFGIPPLYVVPKNEGEKLGRTIPHINDYAYYQFIPLNENTALYTASTQNTYLTIGATRQIGANLAHSLSDWLTVSGGVYAAKYNMAGGPAGIQHFNDLGFTASVRFQIHDRIALRTYGMYSINSFDPKRNFTPAMSGLFPQTHYGGGLEFRITDKVGVEGGMVRELNPMNGKWENRPYIMPVFYSTGR